MLHWIADGDLNRLLRRYYAGEASLWPEIRQHVDDTLRVQQMPLGPYHVRFRKRADDMYDVLIEDAQGFETSA